MNDMEKLEDRLSHATGALDDIRMLVTSCVSKNDPKELHEIAKSVLSRILSSADSVRNKPSWYIHDWEKELFIRYLNGETKAAASDLPCIKVARELETINEKERINEIKRDSGIPQETSPV